MPEEDFSYFIVERKDSIDGSYSNIGVVNDKLGMQVDNLKPDSTYWFKVTVWDIYGNKGVTSNEIEVKTLEDTIRPYITSIKPEPGYYSDIIPISVSARDNFAVETIIFQWSQDLSTWNDISTVNIEMPSSSVTAKIDFTVSELDEGLYYVRAVAVDEYGKMSETVSGYSYTEYRVDRTAPNAPKT